MARGDPVEFVRDLNTAQQRVFNRVKKEAATVRVDHCIQGDDDSDVIVVLTGADPTAYWRFDYIHYSYDGQMAGAYLQITDGVTMYHVDITHTGAAWLPFDTTRWARGRDVTITLGAGGGGVAGMLNVLGVRLEFVHGDSVA